MADPRTDVIGIGNAIVDVLAHADDEFLVRHELAKGSMTLIDAERAEGLYAAMTPAEECSGGSAANTMAGLSALGARVSYIGKVHDDGLGRLFRKDLRSAGVEFSTPAATEGPATGRCIVLVTPDAQRTMQTYLGASATLAPEDVEGAGIERAAITYLEGYLWDPAPAKRAFLRAAGIAHAAGNRVALSLSDSFCVERHRPEFRNLVARHVDILLGNEAEVVSLYEAASAEEAVARLREECEIAAVTRGAQGSWVVSRDAVIALDAEPVDRVVDTTGAGDLYASGFLFGLSRGEDLSTCGRYGSLAAAEIIAHFGARPRSDLAGRLRRG